MKRYILAFSFLLVSGLALGQTMETPVSFDSGGKIMEWTRKMEAGVCLFPDVADFDRALLWKADSAYVLELFSSQGRVRRPLTPAGLDSLKTSVDAFLAGQGRQYGLNQEGRGDLLWWQIPLSLGWYGPAVVAIADPDNGSVGTGLYLISAAATYYIPFMLTKNSQITPAQAHMSIAYGVSGIFAGGALSALLGVDDYRGYCGIMLGTSISGQVSGFSWGKRFTKPQSQMISQYSVFGMVDLPLFIGTLAEDPDEKLFSAAALAGIGGGTYLGHRIANGKDISEGEPVLSETSGLTGMGTGIGLYVALAGKDSIGELDISGRAMCAAMLAGTAGGLYLGHKLSKGYSFTKSDGLIIQGATYGGALLGAGIGFLAAQSGTGADKARIVCGTSTLGLLGGYYLGMKTVRNQEHKRFSGLDINFDGVPLGLALAASKTKTRIPWITGSF
jgi:hypothetical protein